MISSPKYTSHVTLVPNRQVLMHRFAAICGQQRPGMSVAIAPPLFVLSSWVEDLAVRIRQLNGLPVPGTLRALQANWLWRRAVRSTHSANGSGSQANAATQARSAHRLLKQWRQSSADDWLSDRFFRQKSFAENHCKKHNLFTSEDWISDLASLVGEADFSLALLPERITLSGFLELTAVEARLVEALEGRGVVIETPSFDTSTGNVMIHGFGTRQGELAAALDWAREATSHTGRRIAIAAPRSLFTSIADRRAILNGLDRRFRPSGCQDVPPAPDYTFHVSEVRPLTESAVVTDALLLLELSLQGPEFPLPFGRVSRLLLSPFWGLPDMTVCERCELELRLRRAGRYRYSLRDIDRAAREAGYAGELACVFATHAPRVTWKSATGLAGKFRDWLQAWGWPGAAPLDALAQEDITQFLKQIEDLSNIPDDEPVIGIQLLEKACFDSKSGFGGGVLSPLQVVTPEVAVAGSFDALWMIGVDSENWPGAMSRNAQVPAKARAFIPRMTPQGHMDYYRRFTRALAACAPEVHFSWAREAEDGVRGPSTLLREFEGTEGDLRQFPEVASRNDPITEDSRDDVLSVELEALEDSTTFPMHGEHREEIEGGSGFFRAQAACPFIAVLEYRLRVRFPPPPSPLPGADMRGAVLHKALEELYKHQLGRPGVPSSSSIESAIARSLGVLKRAGFSDATILEAETQRLRRLLTDWLQFEGQRAGFHPEDLESKLRLGLRQNEVVVRIDRKDRLGDGRVFLIDYKSSARTRSSKWLQDRIQEPQIPLYAVLLDEREPASVGGVAFALVVAGDCRFDGYSDDADSGASGIRVFGSEGARIPFDSWKSMLENWRSQIHALQDEILAGVAEPRIYDADIVSFSEQLPVLRLEQGLQWLSRYGEPDAC